MNRAGRTCVFVNARARSAGRAVHVASCPVLCGQRAGAWMRKHDMVCEKALCVGDAERNTTRCISKHSLLGCVQSRLSHAAANLRRARGGGGFSAGTGRARLFGTESGAAARPRANGANITGVTTIARSTTCARAKGGCDVVTRLWPGCTQQAFECIQQAFECILRKQPNIPEPACLRLHESAVALPAPGVVRPVGQAVQSGLRLPTLPPGDQLPWGHVEQLEPPWPAWQAPAHRGLVEPYRQTVFGMAGVQIETVDTPARLQITSQPPAQPPSQHPIWRSKEAARTREHAPEQSATDVEPGLGAYKPVGQIVQTSLQPEQRVPPPADHWPAGHLEQDVPTTT